MKLNQKNKSIYINLIKVYGINKYKAFFICNFLGINPLSKLFQLTIIEIQKCELIIEKLYTVELPLKQEIQKRIKKEMTLKTYKGNRHFFSLPVNGQRTRDNAKTRRKFKKKIIISKQIKKKKR